VQVFRPRWVWLLWPLVPVYGVVIPLLTLALDRGLQALGHDGAEAGSLWFWFTLGATAVLLNGRRDRLVLDPDGLRLSEGEAPVDLVAPWSAVEHVRRRGRGPVVLDFLVLSSARVVRREATGRSGLRGPLRERQAGRRPVVLLNQYGRGGWDGPLGDVVRRHRPDLRLEAGGSG
jgi:hypothetical protein